MNKKIAVFHNALDTIGGGEMVALLLCKDLNADLYTTNIDIDCIIKMGFEDVLPRIFSIGKVPKSAPFKQQVALYRFRKLNLKNKYGQYIIAGDWAMSGAVNNKPNIWYAHTPLNEIWSFKNFIKENMLQKWKWPIYDLWCLFNQKLTFSYSKHVDAWVCASDIARERVSKFYNQKNVQVLYPPVNIDSFKISGADEKQDYWLSVTRLAQNKRVEMQIEAFSKIENEKLIIVYDFDAGSKELNSYKNCLIKLAEKNSNITFVHAPNKEELINLYKKSKGFITTSIGESGGTTAIEAMAAGTPVIAPFDGGYKYTVEQDKTGILIDDVNPEKIVVAVEKINNQLLINPEYYYQNCVTRAEQYSAENFIKKIQENIV